MKRVVFGFHDEADKDGGAWGAVTGDLKNQNIDVGDDPFANAILPRIQGQEAIFPTKVFPSFAAFNGQGGLVDEVPFDITTDRTIPASFGSQRLEAAISCMRCHGIFGEDGWKPMRNELPQLTRRGPDIFGDLGAGRKAFDVDTTDRLVGFDGNFDKPLRRARDDLAEQYGQATGEWSPDVVRIMSKRLAKETEDYWYDEVNAAAALRDLGLEVPKGQELDTFRALVPPDLRNRVLGFVPEDPVIGRLRAGLSVSRPDWSLRFAFAAERAKAGLAEVRKAAKAGEGKR